MTVRRSAPDTVPMDAAEDIRDSDPGFSHERAKTLKRDLLYMTRKYRHWRSFVAASAQFILQFRATDATKESLKS